MQSSEFPIPILPTEFNLQIFYVSNILFCLLIRSAFKNSEARAAHWARLIYIQTINCIQLLVFSQFVRSFVCSCVFTLPTSIRIFRTKGFSIPKYQQEYDDGNRKYLSYNFTASCKKIGFRASRGAPCLQLHFQQTFEFLIKGGSQT